MKVEIFFESLRFIDGFRSVKRESVTSLKLVWVKVIVMIWMMQTIC